MQSSTKVSKSFLIINHYAGAPKYGPEFRHFEIAKELVNNSCEVCIVAASFTHLRDSPNVKEEFIDGVKFIWIKCPKYKSYGFKRFLNMFIFSFNLFLRKKYLNFRPDFIIVSSPSPFPILNALYLKFKYNAKLIYEIRDIWPLSIIELKGYSKNNLIIKLLSKLDEIGIKYSDVIMSPLSNIGLYIKEKGFKKKIIILPNGISSNSEESIIKNNTHDKFFTVGYGGSLSDTNSIMNLISAAIKLKNNSTIQFKIIGFGEKENEIKEIIKSKNLKNINLIGRTSKDKLLILLRQCDVLYKGNPRVNIYKYGISSIKLAEYLFLKKPIIDASYGVNIIEKSNSGIVVEHEDSEKLMEGILTMSRMNDQDLEKMAINGYNYALENFLYEKTVANMMNNLN